MKTSLKLQFAALAATAIGTISAITPAIAAFTFGQKDVDQTKFVAAAVPFRGGTTHQLVILEQVSNKRACWSESGNRPVTVNPLLLKFNFTGICGRATDSNGYSIRVAGTDLGMQYNLNIQRVNGEMLLVGTNRRNPSAAPMVIGRTRGVANGLTKISLEPGWRFAKRTYNGKMLGHIYLTNNNMALVNR